MGLKTERGPAFPAPLWEVRCDALGGASAPSGSTFLDGFVASEYPNILRKRGLRII
ncbi:MAG: hypothetical protein ACTSRL_14765 [Candidatus Helarchaeota archaeon]